MYYLYISFVFELSDPLITPKRISFSYVMDWIFIIVTVTYHQLSSRKVLPRPIISSALCAYVYLLSAADYVRNVQVVNSSLSHVV